MHSKILCAFISYDRNEDAQHISCPIEKDTQNNDGTLLGTHLICNGFNDISIFSPVKTLDICFDHTFVVMESSDTQHFIKNCPPIPNRILHDTPWEGKEVIIFSIPVEMPVYFGVQAHMGTSK
jgi:hypothetical protein